MSRIAVIAMEMLWSLYVPMVLFSVHAAHSHKGSHGLFCTNDFVNNVSCTWNNSSVGPGVDCWISGVKKVWKDSVWGKITQRCQLKQHGNSLPGCSFVFENRDFSGSEKMPNISLKCNDTLVETLINYMPRNHIKMQPPGAPIVNSTVNDTQILWSPGSPVSIFLKSFDFEVQLKERKQTWKEARTIPTQEQELRIPVGQLKGYFQVRVRVMPTNRHNSHWSDWSPTTSWVAAMDGVNTSHNQEWWLDQKSLVISGLMFTSCLIFIVILLLYKSCKTKGLLKDKPVPNPSRYFHTLHSVHGGNLKKWLNPLSVSESFFTAEPSDQISKVEVCEDWDAVPSTSPSSSPTSPTSPTSALLHFQSYPSAGSDTSGVVDKSSSSSCFSNRDYFMSSSSCGSTRTHPSPVYFTYHDDFHNTNNVHNLRPSLCLSLTTCPPYESLKREPQSPDSGFGFGEEDEKENEKVMDVEGEQVLDDQSSPLLILPLHLPSQIGPTSSPLTPPHPPSVTQTSSDSQQAAVPVAAASGGSAAWLVSGAMCRSSSMPVESYQTGYLTLKELQMTFSNKSI